MGWLESIIQSGKVAALIGGPPCRSVSVCRERGASDGGPRRVRARTGPMRFGLQHLTPSEESLVNGDSVLWLKMLWLIVSAKASNPKCERTLEQPRDPCEWHGGGTQDSPPPSFLLWPETQRVAEIAHLQKATFDQGGLGHSSKKPTTLLSSSPELLALDGAQSSAKRSVQWLEDLHSRVELSRSLASWAPGLKATFGSMLQRVFAQAASSPRLQALSQEEIQSWKC